MLDDERDWWVHDRRKFQPHLKVGFRVGSEFSGFAGVEYLIPELGKSDELPENSLGWVSSHGKFFGFQVKEQTYIKEGCGRIGVVIAGGDGGPLNPYQTKQRHELEVWDAPDHCGRTAKYRARAPVIVLARPAAEVGNLVSAFRPFLVSFGDGRYLVKYTNILDTRVFAMAAEAACQKRICIGGEGCPRLHYARGGACEGNEDQR